MSFSSEVKEELSKISNLANKELVKYEFLGYLSTNHVTMEKGKNGTKINLNNNKTETLNLKGIQRHTDEYKLIVKYENDPAIIEDITGNVQIKVEAVQSEVI